MEQPECFIDLKQLNLVLRLQKGQYGPEQTAYEQIGMLS